MGNARAFRLVKALSLAIIKYPFFWGRAVHTRHYTLFFISLKRHTHYTYTYTLTYNYRLDRLAQYPYYPSVNNTVNKAERIKHVFLCFALDDLPRNVAPNTLSVPCVVVVMVKRALIY